MLNQHETQVQEVDDCFTTDSLSQTCAAGCLCVHRSSCLVLASCIVKSCTATKHACVQVAQIHKLLVDASPNISHAAAELTSGLLESLGEGLLSEVRHPCWQHALLLHMLERSV